MSDTLKPCPFCGADAEKLDYTNEDWLVTCSKKCLDGDNIDGGYMRKSLWETRV